MNSSVAAATRAQMPSAQPQPLRRSERLANSLAKAQIHRVAKPAQAQPQPELPRALPSSPSTLDTTVEEIILKFRWKFVLIIPDSKAEDRRIRAGPRRLVLEPKWREQKRKNWVHHRAMLNRK